MTACALFLNAANEILIVKPTYRRDEGWLLPGGAVEPTEAPLKACVREVWEELGVALLIKQLLCIEYQTEYQVLEKKRDGDIHFVFYGGVLDDSEIQQIKLPPDELIGYRFCDRIEAMKLLCPRLSSRLESALAALAQQQIIYIEDETRTANWK